MEISELGEFGLIDRLTESFAIKNTSTILSIGDDAAVLNYNNEEILVSTDLLLEGVHFDVRYVPLKHLGYKSAIVNFSDIYAMGGTPRQILIGLGITNRFTVENVEEIYAGLELACEVYGVDLVGGDISASMSGLSISITCIGGVEKGKSIKRNGARPTDLIYVSGDLGAAYMGLQLLERENCIAANAGTNFQPDFAGKEYILERQLKPEARKDIIAQLRANGITPTSMIDISDGLSSELLHICKNSKVGCRIYEDKIPIDFQTAMMAEEFNMNLVTAALNGGEDYELLFSVPLVQKEAMEKISGVTLIGYVTEEKFGALLVTRDGVEIPLRAQGWNSLK